jgi:hypothetical protein
MKYGRQQLDHRLDMRCGQVLITCIEILRIRNEHNLLYHGKCYISLCSFVVDFSRDVVHLPFCFVF